MNLSRILSKQTLLTAIFVGFAFFLAFIFHFNSESPIQNDSTLLTADMTVFNEQEKLDSGLLLTADTAVLSEQKNADPGLLVRLKIPKINIDAAIDPMGIMPNGKMEVPSKPGNVGWYKFGPRPGENGSAVIDGHYGRWKNGEGSVFDDLNKLKQGDVLSIEDEKGVTTTFIVRESRSYDPNMNTRDVFESTDGKSHLNLITCEGVWNQAAKSYSKRLVVFTDQE